MTISIASYTFHGLLREGKMDLFGYLESVKYRYRLDAADIWNGFLPSTDAAYLKKVKEALDEHGLVLVNIAVDGAHIWDEDESVRQKNYENALAHLRAAETLGAQSVRIDIGGEGAELSEAQFDLVVERYREYAQIANQAGFKVGPENHFGPSMSIQNMKRVYEAVDHPNYGILLHMGRWFEDADEGDRVCAPWAMHTHFDTRVLEGMFKDKIRMLIDADYQGWWGVEGYQGVSEHLNAAWMVSTLRKALGEFNRVN